MPLLSLDHVNIRTSNLPAMVSWYTDVLEMTSGKRPSFSFGGAWMYVGDKPIVHLVEVPREPGNTEPKLEHFAIGATGLGDFVGRLEANGVAYTVDRVPDFPLVQVNFRDCDGNHIHVDFSSEELSQIGQ